MKYVITLITAVGTLGLTACKPKEITLSGQVFIVTRGSENIKLGLVEVQLIEKRQIVEFLQEKEAAIVLERASLKREVEAANLAFQTASIAKNSDTNGSGNSPEFIKLRAERAQLDREDYDEWNRSTKAGLGIPSATANAPKIKALEDKMDAILDKERENSEKLDGDKIDAEIRLKNAKENLVKFPTAETYFDNFLPLVIQKTLTDADGKFLISYPDNKAFTLFAKAQRTVGDKTENYVWLVDAPSDSETEKILLSNNNLIFTDPDGFFKIKPQPEVLQQPVP